MATIQDFFEFYYGAVIEIDFLAKGLDGGVIASPASQEVKMVISSARGEQALDTFSVGSGNISLQDAGTGEFLIQLAPSDYADLNEGQRYYYEIWTQLGSDPPLIQARGQITFRTTTGI